MQAAILSIGDELSLGQTVDTNAAWLADRLAERGIPCTCHLTLPDDRRAISDALRYAGHRAGLILASGGLGPTEDDLTRHALADVLGGALVEDETSLEAIRRFFQRRGRDMPERNRVQAMIPGGATALANAEGTAPGLSAELPTGSDDLGPPHLYVMPGVPHEMRAMFERYVAPALPDQTATEGRAIRAATLHTFGVGESDVADLLADLAHRERNPVVGTTVARGIVSVRIRSHFPTATEAERQLERTVQQVRDRLGGLVFGRDEQTLAEVVGRMLADAGQTLSTAESCTAGLLGKMLTDPPGSSAYYLGGYIVYCDEAKRRDLAVPDALLGEHGAVSDPVARALAEHAAERTGADFALAITGIAGPSGGMAGKPVGTVWIALAERDGPTEARRHLLPGDREMVRERSAKAALNMLRLRLLHGEGTAQRPASPWE